MNGLCHPGAVWELDTSKLQLELHHVVKVAFRPQLKVKIFTVCKDRKIEKFTSSFHEFHFLQFDLCAQEEGKVNHTCQPLPV